MTEKLDQAIAAVRRLPPERQDEIAELLEAVATEAAGYAPDQLFAIDEGLADAEAGRFADASDIEAIFARFRGK